MRWLRVAVAVTWVVVLFLLQSPASAEKRVALIIGNGGYQNVGKLTNPSNDAKAISGMLQSAGFDEVAVYENLGIREMRRAINDFADLARDADTAVVYYSGHGVEVNGVNYLIPIDAVLDRDTDVPYETVSLDNLIQVMEPARRLRLVMLDACRDNPFARTMKRTIGSRAIARGLAPVEPTSVNTLIGYAAKAGSIALDGDGPNSPYTIALLNSLPTPGLDLRIAFGRVRDEVLKVTHNRQEPFVYGSLGGTNVSIVDSPSLPVLTPQAPTIDRAERAWAVTKDTNSVAILEDFIRLYGSTSYGSMARARLEELKRSQVAVTPPPPVNPAPPPIDDAPERVWAKTKDTTSIAILEDYIRQFGSTPYGSMARARLEELKKNNVAAIQPTQPTAAPGTSNEPSVLGRWRWATRCPISGLNWTGTFLLKGSPQHITGSFTQDQPFNQPLYSRSIIGGHVSGNTVTFTEHLIVMLGTYNHIWTATLSGPTRMSGQIAATVETCTFTASR
jgi:hypothetical protein